jgi:hypothetical protein
MNENRIDPASAGISFGLAGFEDLSDPGSRRIGRRRRRAGLRVIQLSAQSGYVGSLVACALL